MTLRIEKDIIESSTTFRFSGRMRFSDLEELQKQLDNAGTPQVLDLEEVTLVDVEVVRFLNSCVGRGVDILNGPLYVHEWMLREAHKR